MCRNAHPLSCIFRTKKTEDENHETENIDNDGDFKKELIIYIVIRFHMSHRDRTNYSKRKLAVGYGMIVLLTGAIVYLYISEWRQLGKLEQDARHINVLRQKVHDAYAKKLELAMYGETILEWEATDTIRYNSIRLQLDSLLCEFKQDYPPHRLDSLRGMLKDKEKQLFTIWELLQVQDTLNAKLASQVPVIAYKSTKESGQKSGGFLGLFKKKKKAGTTTSAMLYTLNRDVVEKLVKQTEELESIADSLVARNNILNHQLENIISQMDATIQQDLLEREQTITSTQKRGMYAITTATILMLLVIVVQIFVIQKDSRKIEYKEKETRKLIRRKNQMLAENNELLASRQKMMYTIIHELRIPLSSIIGYADLLKEETDEERQRLYMENIKQASGRMTSQLNMLLSFFRLDCGKEEANLAPFRLTDIVETLEVGFRAQIEAKDIGFIVHNCDDCVVIGDKERMIQIGDNLLSNALKFTDRGVITLNATYKNGAYKLFVSDTGSGMPKGELNRIFKSFERLSNAATQEGFGLGLSIVDNLVRLLGGKIKISSDVGIGTSVSVDIPVARTYERLTGNGQNETIYPKRHYNVVAIDNNIVTLNMIKAMFAKCDVVCDTCVNAGELIELIRHKRYDLLITDLRMPGLNGYDILELLRSSNVNNSQTIPVIVATASGSCTKEELLEKGFSDCIFKPFSKQDLLDTVDRNIVNKEKMDYEPDFTTILEYGDEMEMLDKVISVTEQDIQNFKNAAESKDLKVLDELIHHLRSSWEVLHIDNALWKLHGLLNGTAIYSDDELQQAITAVLETGEEIIRCAKEKKKEVSNG